MRYLRVAVGALVLCASCPTTLRAASSDKPSCKKIHDAVWAGKTLEQITAEFDTDAETVMKCTQKKGKRKAKPKSKKQKGSKSKSSKGDSSTSASSTQQSKSSAPRVRKPSAPASGPRPAYLP
jgi:hypothetical protein